ncbi:NAD(P)H-binding protein [Microbacterium laevaniformans]|uniref:NAD(P)H-binding protein n=1 Tax=Microbacterium laevaniformans TaxID=36807 RepID=UPI003D9847CF
MTVVVFGAGGAVGGAVLAGLRERGVDVRATSRHPDALAVPPGVPVAAADLNDPRSLGAALSGAERVFLYADVDDPEAVALEVAASGVRHVVLLSSSSVTSPDASSDFNASRFLRVERAIRESGVDYTFVRPGGFASNAARWRWGIASDGAVAFPYPDAVQAPIHEADIADVAVAALTTDALIGGAPVLSGPARLSLREQVAVIGAEIGRDLVVVEQTEEEAAAMLSPHVPEPWVRQIIKDWREAVGAVPDISDEYTRITGRPARSFRTWVRDNLDLFR